MNTMSPLSMSANTYVSSASGRGKAAPVEQSEVQAPGEQVTISDAPAAERRSGRGLGRIGMATAAVVLATVLSGCAVTTGGFGPYGYHQETVGVTPNGTIYQHNTQVSPWGIQQQGGAIGPNGSYYYQNGAPVYVVPQHHHHYRPHCTPMTYWSPGTCY